MAAYLHRKYIDLIHSASNGFANWDPLHEVNVGDYGEIDRETGVLCVEGNVYDPAFQQELDKHDVNINLADFLPQEGPVESDFIASSGAKRIELDLDKITGFPAIANAPIKGKWVFERRDKREALLVMHKPRQISMPQNVVLEPLYQVDKLYEKSIVTNIYVCPAYAMYLSDNDTTSNTISLALLTQAPATNEPEATVNASSGLSWWIDASNGTFRNGCAETDSCSFITHATVRHPIKRVRRHFRDRTTPEPTGDELWFLEQTPWDPLDEEGEEDPIDPEVRSVYPFAHVEKVARLKKEGEERKKGEALASSSQ